MLTRARSKLSALNSKKHITEIPSVNEETYWIDTLKHYSRRSTLIINCPQATQFSSVLLISLTVRFLEARTGTASTILLWLTAARIRDQQVSVVFNQNLSQFILGALVHVLGVVCNNRLGNGGTDSIDLRSDTSTLDTDADIKVGELVLSNNQDGLEDLEAEDLRLDVLNRLTIDLDETTTLLCECNSSCCLFPVIQKREKHCQTLYCHGMTRSSSNVPRVQGATRRCTHNPIMYRPWETELSPRHSLFSSTLQQH